MHAHGRVAFLPNMPVRLKWLKAKDLDWPSKPLGEQIRAVRTERGLTQRDAAKLLGVTSWTVANWEKRRSKTPVKSIPAIVAFLGYSPFPEANSLAERLLAKRRDMGWQICDAARHTGVDEATWAGWERGGIMLLRAHRASIAKLLGLPEHDLDRQMAARWNEAHGRRPESS